MIQATFSGFNTALTALRANQARLSLVGQNLSNMNTEGYTRQELNVKSVNYSNPDFFMDQNSTSIGYGVSMNGVTQLRDQFLDIQYRDQNSKVSYNDTVSDALNSLDSYLDETQIDGLSTSFNNIQTALTNMQDPSKVNDPVYEGELRSRMAATANLFNNAASEITTAKIDEYHNLDGSGSSENGDVDRVNQLLAEIGDLNVKIKQNQLVGNKALELQDERNSKIDELSGYIPIEVTYFTDKYATKDSKGNDVIRDRGLNYNSEGVPTGKSSYPEDLKIDLVYTQTNANGTPTTKRLNLVNGSTVGKDNDGNTLSNYGSVKIKIKKGTGDFQDVVDSAGNHRYDYAGGADEDVELEFTKAASFSTSTENGVTYDSHHIQTSYTYEDSFQTDNTATKNDKSTVRLSSGSMQAHLDMLTDNISSQNNGSTYRSFDYYMKRLDNLASTFATQMNILNAKGVNGFNDTTKGITTAAGLDTFNETAGTKSFLLLVNTDAAQDKANGITAANIGVSQKWVNGTTHIGTKGDPKNGNSSTDTVLNMLQNITSTHAELDNKTYSNEMDSISTYLANDSYNNSNALKTNQAVLDSISTSKDQLSGVSLDEEAANMMTFVTSYNAAARLMTAIDETLQSLLGIT